MWAKRSAVLNSALGLLEEEGLLKKRLRGRKLLSRAHRLMKVPR
jgi:hypothetical protein